MRTTLALLVLASGCKSITSDPSPDRTPVAPSAAVARAERGDASVSAKESGDAGAVAQRAPLPPLDWGTRPPEEGSLFPIVDGMCIHATVWELEGGTPLLAYGMGTGIWSRGGEATAAVVSPDGLEPQAGVGIGRHVGYAPLVIGGVFPDHLFALKDMSSRMAEGTELRVGAASAESWTTAIQSEDTGAAHDAPRHQIRGPFPAGDGSYLFVDRAGDEPKSSRFKLLRPDGTMPAAAKVPGNDLAQRAFDGSFVRLASGEMLGVRSGDTKLVRWSPVKPVDDVPLPRIPAVARDAAPARPLLRGGTQRAWLELGGMWRYDGQAFAPSTIGEVTSWVVTEDDELFASTKTGLRREDASGAVTDVPLPIAGAARLVTKHGEVWAVVTGKGTRGGDALFRWKAGTWEAIPLPDPPFGNEMRSALSVEDIVIVAKGDAFVNVRRIEKGYGWKQTEPYRTIYRSRRPAQVLRCQDVRHEQTGKGFHAWPPAAGPSCTTPVVTVLTEEGTKPAADYPNVRAKLRGKTEWGETLRFVNVPGRGYMNLAVVMDDVTKARALATHLSTSLDLRADVHCGKPTPVRSMTFDVAKGTFAKD